MAEETYTPTSRVVTIDTDKANALGMQLYAMVPDVSTEEDAAIVMGAFTGALISFIVNTTMTPQGMLNNLDSFYKSAREYLEGVIKLKSN